VIFEDVVSEEVAKPQAGVPESPEAEEHPRIRRLEQELRSTKEYLQTTIEELETSNEELKSTNEELQSSNEELQSTNEELETSKEELQSVNEELTTVNAEHQQKIEELSKTSSDLNNLLASTEIGTIFLDKNLNIQRFTPTVTDFINLIQTDIGRPLSHIVPNIAYDGLVEDAREVLRKLVTKELEVQTKDGRWHQMRILPYRTVENVIDGVVITFVDITERKKMEQELKQSRNELESRVEECVREVRQSQLWLEGMFEALQDAILIVNPERIVQDMNPAAETVFGYAKDEVVGRSTEVLHVDHDHYVEFGKKIKRAGDKGETAKFSFELKRKNNEVFPTRHTVSLLKDQDGQAIGIVSVVRDRTGTKKSRK
jgi:PAS domain S-box-containing protein